MSAWIVSKGHIDVLVNAGVQYRLLPANYEKLKAFGRMLWLENHRSVNARYDENTPTPPYKPELVETDLAPVHIIAAVHCYDYQSCEHDGWDDSEARAFCASLEKAVETAHPAAAEAYRSGHLISRYGGHEGGSYYWGYEDVCEAVA